jgi:hypothetical protein
VKKSTQQQGGEGVRGGGGVVGTIILAMPVNRSCLYRGEFEDTTCRWGRGGDRLCIRCRVDGRGDYL